MCFLKTFFLPLLLILTTITCGINGINGTHQFETSRPNWADKVEPVLLDEIERNLHEDFSLNEDVFLTWFETDKNADVTDMLNANQITLYQDACVGVSAEIDHGTYSLMRFLVILIDSEEVRLANMHNACNTSEMDEWEKSINAK